MFFFFFFLLLLMLLLTVTKVITGDQKMAKMGQNSIISSFFAEGRSPPQELEVSPRSRLYLLVNIKMAKKHQKVPKWNKIILSTLSGPSSLGLIQFWDNVHPPPHVTCHVSYVTCHVSHVTWHHNSQTVRARDLKF